MENEILKNRNYYKIPNYVRKESKKLEYDLSTWDEVQFKSNDIGFTIDEDADELRNSLMNSLHKVS